MFLLDKTLVMKWVFSVKVKLLKKSVMNNLFEFFLIEYKHCYRAYMFSLHDCGEVPKMISGNLAPCALRLAIQSKAIS